MSHESSKEMILDRSLDESTDSSLTVSLFESLMELSEYTEEPVDPFIEGGGEGICDMASRSSESSKMNTLRNLNTESLAVPSDRRSMTEDDTGLEMLEVLIGLLVLLALLTGSSKPRSNL
jgi:glutaminase